MDVVLFEKNDLPVLIPNVIIESQKALTKKIADPKKKKSSAAAAAA